MVKIFKVLNYVCLVINIISIVLFSILLYDKVTWLNSICLVITIFNACYFIRKIKQSIKFNVPDYGV